MRRLAGVAAAALALAPAGAAHGPVGGGVGYVSTVSGLNPDVLGVIVNVLGGDDRLQLVNYSGKTIDVLGYEGEPFIRFTKAGVFENLRSPATYQSLVRNPHRAVVPPTVDPQAPPHWRKVAEGSTFAWHDHRIHWTEPGLPPVVKAAPNEIHRIFRWRVPGRADGRPFAIAGFLGYRPIASSDEGGGIGWTTSWVVTGAIAVVAATLIVGARRLRRAPTT